jgi:hypothetical protein
MTYFDHTAQRLRELLDYDPITGVLTRRVANNNGTSAIGDVAGYKKPKGYIDVKLGRSSFRAHRLAWLHFYGEWPNGQIDHINGIEHDNRIANLRVATNNVNAQNKRVAYASSKSGILGVHWRSDIKKWKAQINFCGKKIHIGHYATSDEAKAAYIYAKKFLHPGYSG